MLRRLDLRLTGGAVGEYSADRSDQLNKVVDDLLLADFRGQVFESDLTPLIIRRALRARVSDWVLRKLSREQKLKAEWNLLGVNPDMEATIEASVIKIAAKIGVVEGKPVPINAEDLVDANFDGVVTPFADALLENVRKYLAIAYLKKLLYDMIFGLGPLEDLLRSPSITEIMVVTPS